MNKLAALLCVSTLFLTAHSHAQRAPVGNFAFAENAPSKSLGSAPTFLGRARAFMHKHKTTLATASGAAAAAAAWYLYTTRSAQPLEHSTHHQLSTPQPDHHDELAQLQAYAALVTLPGVIANAEPAPAVALPIQTLETQCAALLEQLQRIIPAADRLPYARLYEFKRNYLDYLHRQGRISEAIKNRTFLQLRQPTEAEVTAYRPVAPAPATAQPEAVVVLRPAPLEIHAAPQDGVPAVVAHAGEEPETWYSPRAADQEDRVVAAPVHQIHTQEQRPIHIRSLLEPLRETTADTVRADSTVASACNAPLVTAQPRVVSGSTAPRSRYSTQSLIARGIVGATQHLPCCAHSAPVITTDYAVPTSRYTDLIETERAPAPSAPLLVVDTEGVTLAAPAAHADTLWSAVIEEDPFITAHIEAGRGNLSLLPWQQRARYRYVQHRAQTAAPATPQVPVKTQAQVEREAAIIKKVVEKEAAMIKRYRKYGYEAGKKYQPPAPRNPKFNTWGKNNRESIISGGYAYPGARNVLRDPRIFGPANWEMREFHVIAKYYGPPTKEESAAATPDTSIKPGMVGKLLGGIGNYVSDALNLDPYEELHTLQRLIEEAYKEGATRGFDDAEAQRSAAIKKSHTPGTIHRGDTRNEFGWEHDE